jgi:hypothetical protein
MGDSIEISANGHGYYNAQATPTCSVAGNAFLDAESAYFWL